MANKKRAPGSANRFRRITGRPSGRPARGQANLRERLLDAALVAYASLGATATRSKDVAKIAGVAPPLVNYYFKTRAGLALAVTDERLDPLLDRIWAPVHDETISDDQMLVRHMYETVMVAREYRWFAPLWIREFITEGGILQKHNEQRDCGAERELLQTRMRRGQRLGLIPGNIDPDLLLWSIIGLVLFPFAAVPALHIGRAGNAAVLNECKNHSEEILRRLLAVKVGPASARKKAWAL